MTTSLRNHKAYLPAVAALMTATVYLVCISLRHHALLQPLELKTYDLLRRTQRSDISFASKIVVVGIDEDDIRQPTFDYPIPDEVLTSLLRKVIACGPRVVGVDIYRDKLVPKARSDGTAPWREELVRFWAEHSNVIQVFLMATDTKGVNRVYVPPPEHLDSDQAGAAEFGVDADGVARRGLLFEAGRDASNQPAQFASFDWQVASSYLEGESPSLDLRPIPGAESKDFYLGNCKFRHFHSDDGPYVQGESGGIAFLLDCKSAETNFLHLTGSQILSGHFSGAALRNAVVLIGMRDALSVKDEIRTPASVGAWGIDIHASAVAQLLRMGITSDPQLRFAPHWSYLLWTLVWCLGGGLLGYRVRRPMWGMLGVGGGLAVLLLIGWYAFQRSWWLPIVPPGVCWMAATAMVGIQVSYHERHDRLLLQHLFSSVVAPRVVAELWNRRNELLEEGHLVPRQLHATVMFTDLKGFAAIAERLTPEAMINWINGLMDPMSQLVHQHNGMVKQYAGDAIMALFGVPLSGPAGTAGDALNAVRCALAMRERLEEINKSFRVAQEPEVQMRIGICTGALVAGSIGGRDRSEYTVIGDTVNIASRLENFEKSLVDSDIAAKGCRILIDEGTRGLLDRRVRTRYIKAARLTGDREVRIHGVVGEEEQHSAASLGFPSARI